MTSHRLRPLHLDELNPIIALHRETWHKDTADADSFHRYALELLRTPWARGHVQMLGWFENGRIVATLRLHRLEMLINGHKRQCAGVGSILTIPSERRKGHASRMMREATEQFRSEFGLCLLFSTVGPRFFERLGFFALPSYKYVAVDILNPLHSGHRSGNGNGASRVGHGGGLVQPEARPYQPSDLPRLVEIYNLDVSLRKIGLLRTELYWDYLFARESLRESLLGRGRNELRTYVCNVDGHVASYMAVRLLKDRIQIVESPSESHRFQNWMLHWAVLLSRTESLPRVESQLPFKGTDGEARILVRKDSPLLMLHPLGSGLGAEDFPYPNENFLWSRDRF